MHTTRHHQSMDLEAVLDVLYNVALHDKDGYTAADANSLLKSGENYDNLVDFLASLTPSQRKTLDKHLMRG